MTSLAPEDSKTPPPQKKWRGRFLCLGNRATSVSDKSGPGNTATQFERKIRTATLYLAWFYGLACPVLGFSLSSHRGRESFTIMFAAALIALAFACVGALLGFIFGIPRALELAGPKSTPYDANTNLEQISDWLTKVIVGVSLVQISKLPSALGSLAHHLAPLLGSSEASGGVGVVISMAAAIAAFLLAYLYTRVNLEWLFTANKGEIGEFSKRQNSQTIVAATQAATVEQMDKAIRDNITDASTVKAIYGSFNSDEKKSEITIDFAEFDARLEPIKVPLFDGTTVDQLLNFIFGALPDWVPPRTYGDQWVLRSTDGDVLLAMGTQWARSTGGTIDSRPLKDVGISSGQRLSVIPWTGSIRHRQP